MYLSEAPGAIGEEKNTALVGEEQPAILSVSVFNKSPKSIAFPRVASVINSILS